MVTAWRSAGALPDAEPNQADQQDQTRQRPDVDQFDQRHGALRHLIERTALHAFLRTAASASSCASQSMMFIV